MNVVNQIKELLGMEVKLAQMKLDNGTVLEAEAFEAGMPVFIVNEEDRIALPVGEYKLEDGMMLIVVEEGIIAEVKEAEMPEAEVEAPEVEVEVEQEMSETATPKKVIESTIKESHFSKEEVDALKAEIETLKTELASLKEVKEIKKRLVYWKDLDGKNTNYSSIYDNSMLVAVKNYKTSNLIRKRNEIKSHIW